MHRIILILAFLHYSWITWSQEGSATSIPQIDESASVDSMMKWADNNFYTNRHVSLRYLELLDPRIDTSKCDSNVARYCNLKALLNHEHNRNYSVAENWSLRMIRCSQEIESAKLVSTGHQTLGNIYFYQGQWEKAYQSYFQAKEGFHALQNHRGVALTSSSLAVIKSRMHQYDDAIAIGKEAIRILSSTKDTYNLIIAHQNVGTFYKALEDYDSSMIQQQIALELSTASRDTANLAYTYGFMADVYQVKGDHLLALEFATRSIDLGRTIKDVWLVADNLKVVADGQIAQGLFLEAEKTLVEAIELCDSIQATSMMPDLYDRIQKLYAQRKAYSEAYLALSTWRSLQDSVLGLDQIASMQKLEDEYELRIEQILHEQEVLALKREESRQRQIMLLAVVILTMIIFLVAMWMYARQVSEKMIDFLLLVMVLLIFRLLYLFFDPFSWSSSTDNPWLRIFASVGVAVIMGKLHQWVQDAFKNQIRRSVSASSSLKNNSHEKA